LSDLPTTFYCIHKSFITRWHWNMYWRRRCGTYLWSVYGVIVYLQHPVVIALTGDHAMIAVLLLPVLLTVGFC